jgi:hypothetical protein
MAWTWKLYGVLGVSATAILGSAVLVFATRPNPSQARAEQYAVYSAYIEDGLTGDSHSLGDRRGIVIIAADATLWPKLNQIQRWRFMAGSLLNLQRRTIPPRGWLIYPLFLTNVGINKFDRRLNISSEYELLDSDALSRPNIHQRFPQSYGYLTFSSIAFNPDLSEALFYTEHLCGLCGGGEYVLMRKNDGRWEVVNRYSTWVS